MNDTVNALIEVFTERVRQDEKWGEQNWPIGGSGMFKPTADRARDETERHAQEGTLTWRHILKEEFWETFAESDDDPQAQRAELVQTAAVAVAMIECIDRKARLADEPAKKWPRPGLFVTYDDTQEAEKSRRDRASEAESARSQEASSEDQAQDVA